MANDTGAALNYPSGSAEGASALRAVVEVIVTSLEISNSIVRLYNNNQQHVEKIRKKCRRLAYRCNCMSTVDVTVPPPPPPPQPVRCPHDGAASSSRSRPQSSKGRAHVSDDDTDDSNVNDEDFMPA